MKQLPNIIKGNLFNLLVNLKISYLTDKNRMRLIDEFILHETHKMTSGGYIHAKEKIIRRTSKSHLDIFLKFKNSISQSPQSVKKELNTYNPVQKWMLFHAISYGILNKRLASSVGCGELRWEKTSLLCSDLKFESKPYCLREIKIERPLFTDVLNFAQAKYELTKDGEILGKSRYEKNGSVDRANDPIICRKKAEYYLIHDGTGRMLTLCGQIVENEADITTRVTAWVGEKKRPRLMNRIIYRMARRELFPANQAPQRNKTDLYNTASETF